MPKTAAPTPDSAATIALEERFGAHNYHPLPVVLARGEGVHVWDDQGNRYLDMMSAYSAVSHGHCHPRLVKKLSEQAATLAVCSRAFHSIPLAPFLERACALTGMDRALVMNSGVEAVETALKAARKWAYEVKKVAPDQAEIIVCEGNFHGRTLGVISASTEEDYRRNFGPLLPGFKVVPYGDAAALERAIGPHTAAFLVEPIQGEAGIRVPPAGYLARAAALCKQHNVLLIADEIQTGLGRTGKLLACQHEGVTPDGLILGKALGGGLLPVSMFLARKDVMDVFTPGSHGSTFGGNPLAAAVGNEALAILVEDDLAGRSAELGEYFIEELRAVVKALKLPLVTELRGKGLFIGMEIDPAHARAREVVERLMALGLLSKETHATTVRFAPPLVITREQIDCAVERIDFVLREMVEARLAPASPAAASAEKVRAAG